MTKTTESCCSEPAEVREDGKYGVAVIGAGSAGFSAAITAAELGANVALIGHGTIGGTCVNVGCVPSKTLIRATEAVHHANTASRFAGIAGSTEIGDWKALVSQKDDLVAELRQAKYADLLPAYNNIAYLEGEARLTDGGVAVNGSLLNPGKIIITTGASSAVPPIPGIDDVPYLTSTAALELETLPESLMVIGGGYIGCELAQMFARAGIKVTIFCRSRLLPEAEPEISQALTGYFREEGITVRDGITYREIRPTAKGVSLSIETDGDTETLGAQQVLFIAGLCVVYYWGVPLFAPGMAGEDSVIQYGDSLAGDLSRWLGGTIGRNTAYALSALLAVTAVWALVRRLVLVFRVDTRPSRLPGQDPTVEA